MSPRLEPLGLITLRLLARARAKGQHEAGNQAEDVLAKLQGAARHEAAELKAKCLARRQEDKEQKLLKRVGGTLALKKGVSQVGVAACFDPELQSNICACRL